MTTPDLPQYLALGGDGWTLEDRPPIPPPVAPDSKVPAAPEAWEQRTDGLVVTGPADAPVAGPVGFRIELGR